ncbi:hypothetical protein SapgrDRAFT_2170 [Saprospira grandis DSM 2844]|uniref:Uncharacterized protein n=1 Tax=Saprospira grandis DSM 2844 TaxID=694433 RepID=J1I524_9BACT|nr:hypothetical protein [Saprospira grandis]EJF53850.1 hypothetical protein SapgrDRAFT_2170 [Saprospira grandis DSM 2844]
MQKWIWIWALALCFSCQTEGPKKETIASQKAESDSLSPAARALKSNRAKSFEAYCFFEGDEPENQLDSLAAAAWWAKMQQEEGWHQAKNLLQEKGGGPLGAEWSANTDLYVLLRFPADYNGDFRLSYGSLEQDFKGEPYRQAEGLLLFRLPEEIWAMKASQQPRPKDYPLLFSEEEMQAHAEDPAIFQAANFLPIRIYYKGELFRSFYLRFAYGD